METDCARAVVLRQSPTPGELQPFWSLLTDVSRSSLAQAWREQLLMPPRRVLEQRGCRLPRRASRNARAAVCPTRPFGRQTTPCSAPGGSCLARTRVERSSCFTARRITVQPCWVLQKCCSGNTTASSRPTHARTARAAGRSPRTACWSTPICGPGRTGHSGSSRTSASSRAGASMGAANLIQTLPDVPFCAAVADSPFADLPSLVVARIGARLHLPRALHLTVAGPDRMGRDGIRAPDARRYPAQREPDRSVRGSAGSGADHPRHRGPRDSRRERARAGRGQSAGSSRSGSYLAPRTPRRGKPPRARTRPGAGVLESAPVGALADGRAMQNARCTMQTVQ